MTRPISGLARAVVSLDEAPRREPSMSRAALFAAVALVCAAPCAWAETFEVDSWPGDIDKIPCNAWTRYEDGTWALKGSLKIGASVIDDVGVKGATARSLQKRCGK
jgi:hypothetical protein